MSGDLSPPFSYAVVDGLYYGEPLYTEADALALFMVVGPPADAKDKAEAVAFKLCELGKTFAFDLWNESQPNVTEQEATARRIATALGSALQAAGLGDDEPTLEALHPFLGSGGLFAAAAMRGEPSGKAAVMNAFRAVHLLRADALALCEVEAKRRAMQPPRRGNAPQLAMKRLVAGLAGVYFDVWETLPAFSRITGGPPVGPFIRLMVGVTDALKARGLVFPATAESLAKHWRDLPPDQSLSAKPLTQ